MAYDWKREETLNEQKRIFERYGVCWSSMWELPYWDPTRMLLINSMHCILEGLVHYHCRHVLHLDDAAPHLNADGFRYAFDWPWEAYHSDTVPSKYEVPIQHIH